MNEASPTTEHVDRDIAATPDALWAMVADVTRMGEWEYRFAPSPTGTTVTEIWTDQRGRIAGRLGKPVSGVEDRASHNRAGMEATLARLAEVATA